jgi:hypothetical protein
VGLLLGRPQVRLIHQQCTCCGQTDSHEAYHQQVPPGGNYAYDVMVEVGVARFRDHRQDDEIQNDLHGRWGLRLPVSSIGALAHSFLDGLAAAHQAQAAALRRRLAEEGGHALRRFVAYIVLRWLDDFGTDLQGEYFPFDPKPGRTEPFVKAKFSTAPP